MTETPHAPVSDPPLQVAIIRVTPLQQNCAILWCTETRQATIIDPGGDLPAIRAALDELAVTPVAIWLTHGHVDHAGGAAELRDALAVPVIGPHRADQFLLESLKEVGESYGMAGLRPVSPDRWLDEGDGLDLGKLRFVVHHVPGHAPGHVVFFHAGTRLLIAGDTVFAGAIGRTDLPGGNHAQLLEAIRTRLLPLGDDVTFLPGHGPASTLGHERRTNPFLQS